MIYSEKSFYCDCLISFDIYEKYCLKKFNTQNYLLPNI